MIFNQQELKNDNYYISGGEIDSSYNKIIFKRINGKNRTFINIDDRKFWADDNCCTITNLKFREATELEKKHLDLCIKANKYIELPKEEVINNFKYY